MPWILVKGLKMISVGFRKNLNEALRLIAEKLDLDETRYQNASEKYKSIASWLQTEDSGLAKYTPDVFPQGSFALGTVVKPLSMDEYDIDLVCELKDYVGTPGQIKMIVGEGLRRRANYQTRLEEKNRCWRINYAGDFHMDILPARPFRVEGLQDTAIQVPDKDLRQWVISDPRGYAVWFKNRMMQQFTLTKQILEQKSAEAVPDYKVKTTLQQAIQLMKRNRDIRFENDNNDKPISIIITTLAGQAYLNQSDLFESLTALVKTMPNYIQMIDGEYWVMNPVNQAENFADKWGEHPQRRAKLLNWLRFLDAELMKLYNCPNISDAQDLLEGLFGETIVQNVLKEIEEQSQIGGPALVRTPSTVNVQGNKPWSK